MGLISSFFACPRPLGWRIDVADDSLTAFGHMDDR
jgi:hypothetical protein